MIEQMCCTAAINRAGRALWLGGANHGLITLPPETQILGEKGLGMGSLTLVQESQIG